MTLQIIGSGFGRTGTMATKIALERLGFGSCHHMVEVMGNPAQPSHWAAHAAGEDVDWAEVLAGYNAQVDFPSASVWHELSIAFPDAKVIHTERPEDDWWTSYSTTINKFWLHRKSLDLPPPIAAKGESLRMEHIAFRADDMKAFIAHLEQHEVAYKLFPFEALDIVLVFIRDPDGNRIHVDFAASEQK